MAYFSFDSNTVAPQEEFAPLPAGLYTAMITESEVVPTKAGTGQMLKLTWKVVEGPLANRLIFDRLNVVNANPTAEQIGQRQLSALCHAVGVLQMQDTEQLHGIPCTLRVAIKKDPTGQYADSNEVKAYSPAGGATTKPTAGAFAAPPVRANAAPSPVAQPTAAPPWAHRAA